MRYGRFALFLLASTLPAQPVMAQSACAQLGVNCSHPNIQQRPSGPSPAVLSPDSPYFNQHPGAVNTNRDPERQQEPDKPACHSSQEHCDAGEYNYEEGPSILELKRKEQAERELNDRIARGFALVQQGWKLEQDAPNSSSGNGPYNEALAFYDAAIALHPWPNWILQRCRLLTLVRRDDEALADAQRVIDTDDVPAEVESAKAFKERLLRDVRERMYQAKVWSTAVRGLSIQEPPTPWIEGKSWTGKISSEGTFTITASDGHVVTQNNPEQVASISLANAHVTTGSKGAVHFLLPDDTVFSLGPDSDMVLDTFVYDPRTPSAPAIAIKIVTGVFRWLTGEIIKHQNVKIVFPAGSLGIRGTEFVVYSGVNRNDTQFTEMNRDGFIVLYSGQLVISPDYVAEPAKSTLTLNEGYYNDFDGGVVDMTYGPFKCSDPECSDAFRIRGAPSDIP